MLSSRYKNLQKTLYCACSIFIRCACFSFLMAEHIVVSAVNVSCSAKGSNHLSQKLDYWSTTKLFHTAPNLTLFVQARYSLSLNVLPYFWSRDHITRPRNNINMFSIPKVEQVNYSHWSKELSSKNWEICLLFYRVTPI